ncbi:MAG: glycoside hydrolase family 5 protein [Anaerolineae bacterium]
MDLLQVRDGKVVDAQGEPVWLRGSCVGGWMNMENFIDGYPGAEHDLRAVMAEVLGESKAHFFFERLLHYFLMEDDIAFMKEAGATVVRLSFNYRHFEDDEAPFHYLEEGFARLEEAVGWCAAHELYAILDLHAVQGWQNTDWHCDNSTRHALFWDNPHYQERFVSLWRALADHFKGNPAVAAYNVMNEPQTSAPRGRYRDANEPRWRMLNELYHKVVDAIRPIDPDHIVILEGDNFSSRFSGLEPPFAENLLYSSHNYSSAGFGPGPYPGRIGDVEWDYEKQQEVFRAHEGTQYAQSHNVPLWVGEFGAPYNGPAHEVPDRMRALDDQISVFNEHDVHWTTWTYKDVGVMGWVALDPESRYMEIVAPSLEAKRRLNADFWMGWLPDTTAKSILHSLARDLVDTLGEAAGQIEEVERYMTQATMAGFIGGLMQYPYAELFKGMSEVELDRILQSFAFRNCIPHPGLDEVLRKRFV